MRVTSLSIGLEMRRSNGDYGSDKAEVQVTAALDDGQDPVLALNMLIDMARETVESDLKRSPSLAVRRGMLPEYRTCNRCGERLEDAERGYLHPACKEAEDAEREARYQERLARERERDGMAIAYADEGELVAVGESDQDDENLPL